MEIRFRLNARRLASEMTLGVGALMSIVGWWRGEIIKARILASFAVAHPRARSMFGLDGHRLFCPNRTSADPSCLLRGWYGKDQIGNLASCESDARRTDVQGIFRVGALESVSSRRLSAA